MLTQRLRRVYLETSIFGYLSARPSRNLIAAARQQITLEWWDQCRINFDLYASNVVVAEASKGDAGRAHDRLSLLKSMPLLKITGECSALAEKIVLEAPLPRTAQDDALHIAISCYHGVDFLLTWNFRHLANAYLIPVVRKVVESAGFPFSQICTPEELMGGL